MRRLRLRLRSLFQKRQVENELDEEFDYHLTRRTEEYLQQGLCPEDARYAALRAMQGMEQNKERCRDARRVNWLEHLIQDLRYAMRMLWKKPVFTLVAILSLALGIGANAAVFSLLDDLLLTKLPVPDADNLYQLIVTHRTQVANAFSYPDYEKLRTGFDIFENVTAWRHQEVDGQVDQAPMRLHAALVTGSFHKFMRVKPALGRLIEDGDDTLSGAGVAVLGYGFWQRQFSGDASVLGKVIQVQGAPFVVIGVTPRDFGGAEVDYPRDVTLPVHAMKRYDPADISLETPGTYQFSVLVRLKPGVTMQSARPMLRDVWPSLAQGEAPLAPDGWRQKLDIQPGSAGVSHVRNEFSRALVVLMVLVGLVLLITCANLANLLLARAMGRKKEIAVRLAIGASRGRLIRQSLTESLLLAVLGGGGALLLAGWLTRALLQFLPRADAGYLKFQADHSMLLFATALTVGTALLFGLLPAFQAVRVPLNLVMNEAGRVPGTGRSSWIARGVVAGQVAVCVVLVIGAFLFTRSLQNISRAELGFSRGGLLLLDVNTIKAGIRGERNDVFYQNLLTELNQTPGILSASCSRIIPLTGSQWWDPAVVPGYLPARDEMTTAYINQVAPDYFRTLRIPVLEGREFTAADVRGSRRVAVVNQSFVRRFFQGRNALGRGFSVGDRKFPILTDLEIVGVVADTKYTDPRETQKDLVYLALYQGVEMSGTFEVRFGPGVSVEKGTEQVRAIVNRIGSGVEADIRPFDTVFDRALKRDRMVALLSGLFGALGVVLACIGLYGIVSQSVTARTAEIGIRMTLGARWWQVEWMVLRETLAPVAAGIVIGMPLALAAAQLLNGLLFGLTPFDPGSFAGTAVLLVVVGVASAWIPARRASRIAPLVALRQD
jgi:predicted permease